MFASLIIEALDLLLELGLVQLELFSLRLNVTEALTGGLVVKLTIEVRAHQLDEVLLRDLLRPCLIPKVVLEDLDIFVGDFNAVLFEGEFEFLSRQPPTPILVVLFKLLHKIDSKLLQLRRQWLDYILNTQVESLLLHEFGRDDVQEVCLGDLACVPTVEVLLHVMDLSLDQIRLHLFEQALELSRSHLVVLAVHLRMLIEEVVWVDAALR